MCVLNLFFFVTVRDKHIYYGNEEDAGEKAQISNAKTVSKIRQLLDLFEEDIGELFPDLEKHCLWKIRQAGAYGIAQAPGLVGKLRPHMCPPGIDNLYLVSDTMREARGTGTQAAAKAALQCASLILGDGKAN